MAVTLSVIGARISIGLRHLRGPSTTDFMLAA